MSCSLTSTSSSSTSSPQNDTLHESSTSVQNEVQLSPSKSSRSSNHIHPHEATKYDLQDLVEQYKSQPELLKLILISKVEEDKRRAEEAKLRAKELDVYLHQQRRQALSSSDVDSDKEWISSKSRSSLKMKRKRRSPCSVRNTGGLAPYSTRSKSYPQDENYIQQQRRHSAAAAMLAMGTLRIPPSCSETASDTDSVGSSTSSQSPTTPSSHMSLSDPYGFPALKPDTDAAEDNDHHKPRRREMQAITKIVETREFPYNDNYFWKNNGNTTQKKTGCKSIYYKCSNSNKGCLVNKTVTARPNGEYLIKYRGSHLPECGRVERVCDL
ncbi:uncharacterized protein BYT42DRAFT_556325 [Radiomyces spectabilis]|uniref:uncharacterized protein n=1 Tax=Radiomyces spectabilis TaxID=64574 RepID=UPI0022207CD7|nr:uncharacterized protein BYT42DRAFT_556325 [Radiomyces spectabilis]KAI8391288.1 hypothetical protein BYT42DRAFT_556325 [Radiomyces spectabilis]